jgi:hypothetical protein
MHKNIFKEGLFMRKKYFMGLVTVIVIFSLMVSSAFAAATSYDSFAQFDTTSATGTNVPWLYYVTTDEGATFTPCTVMEAWDKLQPWHPFAGNWTGVGINGDVPDFLELNADGKGGMYGALSFKAPEDGTYTIQGSVKNVWEQPAELLHVRLNGTDLLTVEPSFGADAASAAFEQTGIELKAGEEVFFFCPSTTDGGWVSAYIQLVVTKEATEAEATEAEATTAATATTEAPKTGVAGLGLLFGAGAIITGAISLKKKSEK